MVRRLDRSTTAPTSGATATPGTTASIRNSANWLSDPVVV